LPTDITTIIDGCSRFDRASQEALYRHCYPAMLPVCSRYASDPDEAGWIFNDAMLKVFTHIGQYRGSGNFMSWVRRIVVNACVDHYRRNTKFDREQSAQKQSDTQAHHDPEVYNHLSAREVMEVLRELPPQTALVFNLYVFDGYTHTQIAGALDIPAGTSKWHLSEARRILRNKLDHLILKEIYDNAI
jgi:RNA polymerase sigma-70 factor, ECF subfamily